MLLCNVGDDESKLEYAKGVVSQVTLKTYVSMSAIDKIRQNLKTTEIINTSAARTSSDVSKSQRGRSWILECADGIAKYAHSDEPSKLTRKSPGTQGTTLSVLSSEAVVVTESRFTRHIWPWTRKTGIPSSTAPTASVQHCCSITLL